MKIRVLCFKLPSESFLICKTSQYSTTLKSCILYRISYGNLLV